MILLGTKELKSLKALRQRREYVMSLINEGLPSVSPSSQEWTSPEFQAGHMQRLRAEVGEIDALVKKLEKKNGNTVLSR